MPGVPTQVPSQLAGPLVGTVASLRALGVEFSQVWSISKINDALRVR